MERWIFYEKMLLKHINKNSNFLLISGSEKEIQILKKLRYKNFKITYHKELNRNIENNYNLLVGKNLFDADVRNLRFNDSEFDYVITNATLHHIDVPHVGISEMYRVAKKGVLIIESNDSLIMRLACKIKLSEEFEESSVDRHKKTGGLLDLGIPNYVYRWTENEVEKLISSFNPKYNHVISYNYEFEFENILKKINNKFLKSVISFFLKVNLKMLKFAFKKQSNLFSFFINKKLSKKNKHSWIN